MGEKDSKEGKAAKKQESLHEGGAKKKAAEIDKAEKAFKTKKEALSKQRETAKVTTAKNMETLKIKEHYAKEWMKVHEASKSLKSDTNAERDHKRKVMQAFEQLQGQTKQKIVKSKEEIRNKVAGVR